MSERELDTEEIAVNAASLPLMLAFGWLLSAMHAWFVVGYLFHTTYHELGHTVTAWLSGRTAFPIPVLVTFIARDRLTPLSLAVVVGLLVAAGLAARARRIGLALITVSFAALAIDLSFILSPEESLLWVTFGGCGGEIVLSALVAASFYAAFPSRLRWDFWRWPFVLVACCVFVNADHSWRVVASDPARLPRGTAMSGSRDANGDMDKLLRGGWTPEGIADAYLGIADAAWVALGILYGVCVARAVIRARAGRD